MKPQCFAAYVATTEISSRTVKNQIVLWTNYLLTYIVKLKQHRTRDVEDLCRNTWMLRLQVA